MRKLKVFRTEGKNSLCYWASFKNPVVVSINFLLITLAKYVPSLSLRRSLLRLTGMKVGEEASVGLGAMFDIFYPELIELGDNCIIGYNATILAHEFLRNELRVGKTVIGKDALIGANATVLAGVIVGEGASVSAATFVDKDVPDCSFAKGNPMKVGRK